MMLGVDKVIVFYVPCTPEHWWSFLTNQTHYVQFALLFYNFQECFFFRWMLITKKMEMIQMSLVEGKGREDQDLVML